MTGKLRIAEFFTFPPEGEVVASFTTRRVGGKPQRPPSPLTRRTSLRSSGDLPRKGGGQKRGTPVREVPPRCPPVYA